MVIARETYCTNSLNITSEKLKKKKQSAYKNRKCFLIQHRLHTFLSVTDRVDEEVTLSTT